MPDISNMSTTAKIMVSLKSDNQDLASMMQTIFRAPEATSPKNQDFKAVMKSVIDSIPFEANIAQMRRRIKSNDEIDTLKTSFATIQEYINVNQKSFASGTGVQLLKDASAIHEKITQFVDGELQNATKKYLDTCTERLNLRNSKNDKELKQIELSLKEQLPKLEKLFDNLKILHAEINKLYSMTPNAPANIRPVTPVSTPRPGGSSS